MTRPRRQADLLEFVDATHVRLGRHTFLYFGGCNYLGLSFEPSVRLAMQRVLERGPVQPGASRATTGDHWLYRQAEQVMARWFRVPVALLVNSGYLAPLAAVQALAVRCTHLLVDDRSHVCIRDAAAASGRPVIRFPHGQVEALRQQLRGLPRGCAPLLLTDGTLGTRSGMAPLDAYLGELPAQGWMLVDDAHGAGTVGPDGRGAVAHFRIRDGRVVQAISLAKAFGVGGGAVLGGRELLSAIRLTSPAFVGSTTLPLSIPAGVVAALTVLRRNPGRVHKLQAHQRRFHAMLPSDPRLSCGPLTPVTTFTPSGSADELRMRRALVRAGIYPSFIHYPGGASTGFLRLALSARHSRLEVERLAAAVVAGMLGAASRSAARSAAE